MSYELKYAIRIELPAYEVNDTSPIGRADISYTPINPREVVEPKGSTKAAITMARRS